MRKSSESTLWLQVIVFTHFIGRKQERRNNATLTFSGYIRRPTIEPLFTTHPSEVGSTSPWTLSAAMMRGRSLTRFVAKRLHFCWVLSAIQGASAWSSCLLSALMRCVIAFHRCLSRRTGLDTSSSHPCTELHDLVTLHGSSTIFMHRPNMKRRVNSTSLF